MSEALSAPQFLIANEAAAYTRMTLRSLHERTSKHTVPFRRIAGMRKLLFVAADLDAWLNGAPLETIELPDGGLIVRPAAQEAVTA
jgi:hypothetical protein